MKCNVYYKFFKNFSNKAKLDIIQTLASGPCSVNEITEKTKAEQSAVSHNLKLLSDCNIVHFEQKGKQRIYFLNKETVIPILELTKKHAKKFCKGDCGLK